MERSGTPARQAREERTQKDYSLLNNPRRGDRDSVVPSELIHLRTLSRGSASLHPCLYSSALSVHYKTNPISFPFCFGHDIAVAL